MLNAIELDRAARKHPQVRTWVDSWLAVVEATEWRNLLDVKRTYPSADGVTLGHGKQKIVVTVFNVGGNEYRLLTKIAYEQQLVQVLELLTHAEYTKEKWKKRYG